MVKNCVVESPIHLHDRDNSFAGAANVSFANDPIGIKHFALRVLWELLGSL